MLPLAWSAVKLRGASPEKAIGCAETRGDKWPSGFMPVE